MRLMKQFKDVVFTQGSSLNYELVENRDPALFREVLEMIKEGRWRVTGAPFLEFDAFMPSGESIVRHLLYGRRYFEGLGVSIEPVLFLPDSFGFPSSLPRILRGFGIRFFVTYKLNWNDTNKIGYYLFYWGSNPREKVLTYILPGNYNDYLSDAKRLLWNFYKQLSRQSIPAILTVYGRGDHGGGPEDVEIMNIMSWRKKLSPVVEILPSNMENFLEYIERAFGDAIPRLDDELYLEFHRGSYTTGVTIKRLNRLNESLMLQVEKLYTLLLMKFAEKYPYEDIKKVWKEILLNQGHDSLAGTLTREVYAEVVKRGFNTFNSILGTLLKGLEKLSKNLRTKYVIFNPNTWLTDAYIRTRTNIDGLHQPMKDGTKLYYVRNIPSLGYKGFSSINEKPEDTANAYDGDTYYILENRYLRVAISKKSGWISSVFDKVNEREILKEPIRLRIMWDIPAPFRVSAAPASLFDAWEVYYREWINKYFYKDLKAYRHEINEKGPMYASVKLEYKYRQITSGTSLFEVEVGLYADKPYLEIMSRMFWKARHRLLKLLIPLGVNTKKALFEVPYGVTAREDACVSSNSVSNARYEVPGQRWVDISDDSYGVAVITDSRYGYSWCDGVLGVSLIRAPAPPDKDLLMKFISESRKFQERFADISMELMSEIKKKSLGLATWLGVIFMELLKRKDLSPVDHGYHTTRVWIYPHQGDYSKGKVIKYAVELNTLYFIHKTGYTSQNIEKDNIKFSLMEVEPNDVIEVITLKPCEVRDCIAVRLFNTSKENVRARINVGVSIGDVYEADLTEKPLRKIKSGRFGLNLEFKPNEIKTILIFI